MDTSRVKCPCGHGYRSAYDGKCGHCRNSKERKAYADPWKWERKKKPWWVEHWQKYGVNNDQ